MISSNCVIPGLSHNKQMLWQKMNTLMLWTLTVVQLLLTLAVQVSRLPHVKPACGWGALPLACVCSVVVGFACSDFFKIHVLFIHSHAFVYICFFHLTVSFEERKSICHLISWPLVKSSAYHRSSVNIIDSFSNCWSPLHFGVWLFFFFWLFYFSSVVPLSPI